MKQTIAVLDPVWRGHHGAYLAMTSRCLLDQGHRVVAFTPRPDALAALLQDHSAYAASASRCEPLPAQEPPPPGRFGTARRARTLWRQAAQAVQGSGAQVAFFPWLDSYLDRLLPGRAVDRVFDVAWSGIYFHPRHARGLGSRSALLRALLPPDRTLRAARCVSVGVLDLPAGRTIARRLGGRPVIDFPDVADASPPNDASGLAARVRTAATGRFVVGVLGSLEKRKGVLTALDAAALLEREPFFFVFAGPLAEHTFTAAELERVRRAQGGNLLVVPEEIPGEAGFNALVDACDAVFAAYEGFPHSSNLLTKAALHRKPVIVSRGFYMEELAQAYELGPAVPEGSSAACADALRRLREERPAARPRFDDFVARNSVARFCGALREALAPALGGPA